MSLSLPFSSKGKNQRLSIMILQEFIEGGANIDITSIYLNEIEALLNMILVEMWSDNMEKYSISIPFRLCGNKDAFGFP